MDAAKFDRLRDFFAGLIAELEESLPYASAFAARREGVRIIVSSTQMSVTPESPSVGICLSLWNGEQFFEYSTNRFDLKVIREESLQLARRASRLRRSKGTDIDPGERLAKDFATQVKRPGRTVDLEEKLALAKALQQSAAESSPRVKNAIAFQGELMSEEIFVNRCKHLYQQLHRYDELLQVFVADSATGRFQQLWDGNSLAGGWEHAGFLKDKSTALVADAERLLGAPRLAPGFYDIVAAQDWSGILAHEAFGHGTETDMYLKDRAKGRGYTGRKVASNITTLVDDPTLPGQAGTFFFDHEGALARPNLIVDKGILRGGMTDLYSATVLGLPRSANGRRESWERKAYARMTNTFFKAGSSKPSEMIAAVADGIYLRYPSNGMEDPQGWGIQCEGLWAQKIENGKLSDQVYSPVIMTGYVPDILESISMVGDDLVIVGSGYCGKGRKEWVKTTTGGPHLRFKARLG